jgi:hypothetical protein
MKINCRNCVYCEAGQCKFKALAAWNLAPCELDCHIEDDDDYEVDFEYDAQSLVLCGG